MDRRLFGLGAVSCAMVAGCSQAESKFKSYSGPEVSSIVVNKGARKMYLVNNEDVLLE